METTPPTDAQTGWSKPHPFMELSFYEIADLVEKRFFQESIHREYSVSLSDAWRCDLQEPPDAATRLAAFKDLPSRNWDGLYEHSGCLYYAAWSGGRVSLDIAGTSLDACHEALAKAKELMPLATPASDGQIPATIWVWGKESGARARERKLEVPLWSDIAANYAATTRAELDGLTKMVRPTGGKLLLWNGPPGTGKTYALRSLARAWSSWCELHYVVDPEALLGRDPEYLMDLILREPKGDNADDDDSGKDRDRINSDGRPKWRLLVLEDAGELIALDARQRVGAALSRLLNLSDGILGQGFNLLTLITTNEELGKLNPAVQRPGRCLGITTFQKLSRQEAEGWAAAHASTLPDDRDRWSLADLYAHSHGARMSQAGESAGFHTR